jgi:Leucine-rich repeat (LRR) protein
MPPDRKKSEAEKIYQQIKLKTNLSMTELNLSGLKLTSIPGEVIFPETLILLNLSQNGLQIFPRQICDLEFLQILNVSCNFLTKWSIDSTTKKVDEFKSCQTLKELDLSNNQFDRLPPWFNQLRRLRVVNLDFNPIFELQESVR